MENLLTIAFDAKRAAQNNIGLGNYSRFVVRSLSRFSDVGRMLLYAPNPQRANALDGVDCEQGVEMRYPTGFWAKRFIRFWRSWGITNDLKKEPIDIYHGLSSELPLNIRKAKNIKTVVTIHDLIFRIYPKYYHFFDRLIYNVKARRACKTADRIIAISECTKRDIIKYYGTDPKRIDVVYQGCDQRFSLQVVQSEIDDAREKYGLPTSFVLYLGTIEPRKNLLLLAKALEHLPKDVKVVAVGQRTKYAAQIERFIKVKGLEDRMLMLSRVPFEVLPVLFRMASVFVYPSRYEGFGIPILEALTCGVPVVACTGSCLEEAGGQSSLYVSPDDEVALAQAIQSVLTDFSLREKMIADGLEYAKQFSPQIFAKQQTFIYQKVINA